MNLLYNFLSITQVYDHRHIILRLLAINTTENYDEIRNVIALIPVHGYYDITIIPNTTMYCVDVAQTISINKSKAYCLPSLRLTMLC